MPSYRNRATGEIVQATVEEMAYAQGWDEVQTPSHPPQRSAVHPTTDDQRSSKPARSATSAKFRLGGEISINQLRIIFIGLAFLFFVLATNMRSGEEWVFLLPSVGCVVLVPFAGRIIRRQ